MAHPINLFKESNEIQIRLEKLREFSLQTLKMPKILFNHRDKKKLKDKVVVITGASSGIGRATAIAFAGKGAKLILASRNEEELNETRKTILQNGGAATCLKTDVTDEYQCMMLVENTLRTHGRIDIFIANAGLSMRANFDEVDLSVLKKLMDVNFWGMVYSAKYALPQLYKTHGSFIAVSSMAAFTALPGRTGYCASKSAVNGFIDALRMENRKKNVHIMLVSPGYTESNIRNSALLKDGYPQNDTPLNEKKLMTADKVAHRMLKATLRKRRSITLTFNANMANLVGKFYPPLVERVVSKRVIREDHSFKV